MENKKDPLLCLLMFHIQQHVVNEFMDEGLAGEDFYINNEEDVHSAFNEYIHLGQDVVDEYIKSNKCGLSIKSVNEVLYVYKEIALDMDLEMEDNIGQMVNCIMFNIANSLSGALEFE
mgnify:CR=1 FL=1